MALYIESLSLPPDIILFCKNIKELAEKYNVDHFLTEELKSFIEKYLVGQEITKSMLILILRDLQDNVQNIINSYMEDGEPIAIKYNTNNKDKNFPLWGALYRH